MLTSQRKKAILDALDRDGQVLAGDLSAAFGVSEDTVRRDLRELAAQGRLQRVHGGALPASAAVAPLAAREDMDVAAKQRVARKAASMIEPGQVAIVDGGTTSALLVQCLTPDLTATIVTHSPGIAVALAAHPCVEVVLIGGRLYKHSVVSVGAAAIEAMSHIHADLYFMGVTGVHASAGFSTGDYEETYVKRALAARAAETVVLACASKLNTASQFRIGGLEMAQTLVVDAGATAKQTRALEEAGLTIVRA
ncbi:DeoR/GlpR family transcriptional regulator of sugar metabolism [Paraburkholderia bannensis]|uniref:DeoR/GlpR family transcriptional regulator of sugar metabolism n=1 Tax=Paraburkholderia bannensis TaxID=765414 RepID=A0A7W9TW81_9BURK|nr:MULTISPECIES: DeoR/GlpR family DNA-binding transcription regulator [Paraburkholderia]MBB3257340.1 DeoR/GlpR family transcriptional regulator of sugar metabolism [Paraburkholderia sp. WP4_3_2]MBB6102264.1 DeoR/GlpR family transcriptional regulator of sugar metabolism [Paraburkholderia bannensis]